MLANTVAVQSGDWLTPSTWSNGVPTLTSRAIIGQGQTVTLNGSSHIAQEIVVQGTLNVAEGAVGSGTKALEADWIHVNSGGVFQVGTAANRYDNNDFQLTLTGTNPLADWNIETAGGGTMSVNNNNGFLMTASGGQLQFYGEEKLSFTKLAATAIVGSNAIVVENVIERNFDGTTSTGSDGALDWQVGDQIVIASSSYDYADEEVRTITAISAVAGNKTVLILNAALAHRHYGEIENYSNPERTFDIDLRAEVALLNRSITVQGIQDTDTSFGNRANYGTASGKNVGIGAHTMIMPNSGQITIDGVQFDKMGQTGRLGRYPVHWHVAGDRGDNGTNAVGDVMRNSSVTNSNNRGVTVHGTQNVLLEDNVLHDIHGHGFFMEDAAETGNQFISNIVLGIHKVGGKFNGNDANDPFIVPGITRGANGKVNGEAARNGNGESSHDTGQNFSQRFLHSAAYWITNPDNTWVGNVSAGSEGTGFWFALPDAVMGLSKDTGLYNSLSPRTTNLDQFDNNTTHSAPVGLTFDRGADILPGSSNNYAPSQLMQINGLTAYKHDGTAVYHRASVGRFNESRFADNENSSFNTFRQEERNVLFVGHSIGNADLTKSVGGFRLYDGPGRIVDSHFAGFAADNAFTFRVEGGANKHTHTTAQGITFEDDGTADHLSVEFKEKDTIVTDNSPVFVSGRPDGFSGLVLDVDGSLTGHAGGGAGHVLTPKLDFYRDSTDIAPAGWDAYISDDRFGQLKIGTINDVGTVPDYRIENGDGHAIVANRTNLAFIQRQYAKVNAGDYTVNFLDAIPSTGFEVYLDVQAGGIAGDSTVLRFVGAAEDFKPTTGNSVNSLTALRDSSQNSYLRDYAGDLWMKIFEARATLQVKPTNDSLPTNPQSAYVSTTVQNGTRIEAEEFDLGGYGFAFSDTTAGNSGGAFRPNQGVDIQATTDNGGGFNVGWTADGEFLEYTANVVGGIYDIDFRVASNNANAKSIRLLVGDGDAAETFTQLGVIDVPVTGSSQDWQTHSLDNVDLTAWQGSDRVFRVEIIGGSFNLNWLEFNSVATTSTVVNRGVTYGDASASYGEDAIDTTKSAYFHSPGTTSTAANYTNYTKGLNRVIVDLTNPQAATLTTADFEFRVGNTSVPANWDILDGASAIPLPTVINGARDSNTGIQRFTLAWEGSQTIKNQWLQVTVKAGGNTGLASDDVFYFGNQIADVSGTTNAGQPVRVDIFDLLDIKLNQGNNPHDITNEFDIDRSGRVNSFDLLDAKLNQSSTDGLLMLSAPSSAALAARFQSLEAMPAPALKSEPTLYVDPVPAPEDISKEISVIEPMVRVRPRTFVTNVPRDAVANVPDHSNDSHDKKRQRNKRRVTNDFALRKEQRLATPPPIRMNGQTFASFDRLTKATLNTQLDALFSEKEDLFAPLFQHLDPVNS